MDNYHVYEEVGAGTHSQVFKGRRKMDIEYVAIKRVEKSRMENVVQEVQVIHRLNSPNVLKFYDWYETRNNVWLILEFCTGGDLRTLIKQDHREPESAVRLFGVDLLAGLQQTHAGGFLHGDLRPSSVLIDEYGILKLGGYGFSRSVADIDAGGRDASEGGNARMERHAQEHQNHKQCGKSGGAEARAVRDPTYMAPELFSGDEDALSFASDFWSLGCVLFELLTGEPPFRPSRSTSVTERIVREDPPGLDKGEWQGARMSPHFRTLVGWLLQKDPLRRPTWPQLLAHPFWGNCQTPSLLEMPAQPRFDQAVLSARVAAANRTRQASARGIGSNLPRSMEHKHAAEEVHTTDDEGRWRMSDVGCGENSPAGGARRARPAGQIEAGKNANQRMSPRKREGMERAGDETYETERNYKSHRGLKQSRKTASRTGGFSPVGITPGKASETGEVEQSTAVTLISPPPGSGQQYERARDTPSNGVRGWSNGHVEKTATANCEPSRGSRGKEDSFMRSLTSPPLPPGVSVTPTVELRGKPHQGQSGCIGETTTMGKTRNVVGEAGSCTDAEVAKRAAALKSLRLRIRTPPGRGGRISPSVLSTASAASSVGEQYGSNFEEETEGSSSCSTGTSSVGGCNVAGAGVGGLGDGAPAAAAETTAGDTEKGYTVMTPGSVRTNTTASPSTGCTPRVRCGDFMSSVIGRVGRARAVSGQGYEAVIAEDRMTTADAVTSCDWRQRHRRRPRRPPGDYSPSPSSTPSAGSSRSGSTSVSASESRSRLDFPPSESGKASSEASQRCSATALSFEKSARSPAHERISKSLWKTPLSSVVCSVHPPAEIVASGNTGGVLDSAKTDGATRGERRGTTQVGMPKDEAARERRGFAMDRAGENGRVRECARPSPSRRRAQPGTGGLGDREAGKRKDVRCEKRAGTRDTRELLLHASDAKVNPIVEIKSVKSASVRQRGALLPAAVGAMTAKALDDHLTAIYRDLSEASAPARKQGQTLLYLQSLARVPRLATILINSVFLVELLRLLRRPRPAPIRDAAATVIGQLVRHATFILPVAGRANSHPDEDAGDNGASEGGEGDQTVRGGDDGDAKRRGAVVKGGGLVSALIATVRERPAPGQGAQAAALRRKVVAALGELLFYIVTQEHCTLEVVRGGNGVNGQPDGGNERQAWNISAVAVRSVIEKCLGDEEREDVQNSAAKTVKNVLARAGPSHPLISALVTPELALRLLDVARHAHSETLRGTAASGLSHILEHDILGDECHVSGSTGPGLSEGGAIAVRRTPRDELMTHCREKGDDRREGGGRWALSGGWIALRVASQPGVAAAIVHGLSEESSPASRLAFLNIVNLLFWGAARSRTSSGARRHSLWQAAEVVLESQQDLLLPMLLRIVEHGEGVVLRGKGFLALRLTLEFASPSLLLDACCSRMLPLLARVIGALDLRMDGGSASRTGVGSVNGSDGASRLSPQEEYLYECGNDLAGWLCTVPETTTRRLFEELRKRRCSTGVVVGSQHGSKSKEGKQSRQSMDDIVNSSLEVAMGACSAMVLLVNNPLLRPRVVTDAFLRDLSACLALSCPVDAGSAAESNRAELDGSVGTSSVLAALLPTVEALAQQAETALLPHRETVSSDLIPVLCRLLRSPSGDTRALALAVMRVLLPPLLRPVASSPPHLNDRCAPPPDDPSSLKAARPEGGMGGSPKRVSAAVDSSLLPLVAELLNDHAPVPQYTVRLLLDVAREWSGLGPALLAKKPAISALLIRLPAPLPPPSASALWAVNHNDLSARSDRPQSVPRRLWKDRRDDANATSIDPAVATLLTVFVERCNNAHPHRVSNGGDDAEFLITLLRYELPGRVAAAVVSAVAAELPEVVEEFLGLAVALLEIALLNRGDEESSSGKRDLSPRGVYSRRPASAAGEWKGRRHREISATLWGKELATLLAAVPTAVEGMRLFCVRGGSAAEHREKLGRKKREMLVDDGVRSGIADVTTQFLEGCHQLFHDRLLRSLVCSPSGPADNDHPSPPTAPSVHASTAIICRHVAEFLDNPDPDERPRLRILRILLAAASARDHPLGRALEQGPLWAVLLLLATGRAGGGRALRTHGGAASGVVGPTQALARDVVAAIRVDRVDFHGTTLKTRRRRSTQGHVA